MFGSSLSAAKECSDAQVAFSVRGLHVCSIGAGKGRGEMGLSLLLLPALVRPQSVSQLVRLAAVLSLSLRVVLVAPWPEIGCPAQMKRRRRRVSCVCRPPLTCSRIHAYLPPRAALTCAARVS